ncbi:MAG: bifunctional diaminohydroxyphosphoribosylaminopyrimidine deaminase/5-amino-6-(5-phosphoribosylamino)uracil reductase RibD [Ignavibacteria bacterium]|nr:bifunctional diaminohydroxyphosphoribosylaminopyrimidine deaminase/5-amino-6-(5-phosphoribosylamino)uracil reductase RibD [Ignavibacteria bacterium]
MNRHEKHILKTIELAIKGAGYVSPNPMVGCVIVKNGKIIGEGYHRKFGGSHAEVNAVKDAIRKGYNLKGASMYVTLEPCCHHGKTPPCTDMIISSGIKEVIIGSEDPNSLVSGKGIKILKEKGIKVKSGVLQDLCQHLNRFFFKYIRTGLPYVIIKIAQTLDGKIADEKGNSKWISSYESRKFVHLIRSKIDAVLIGSNTLNKDNPSLTVRHVKGRNPFRIIISRNLSLDIRKKIFSDKYRYKTIILTSSDSIAEKSKYTKKGIKIITCKTKKKLIDLEDAMRKVKELGIASLMVEGGSFTASEFIRNKLYDEIMIFQSPRIMGNGLNSFTVKASLENFKEISCHNFGKDILINLLK